jgi:hypothetical protein
MEFQLGCIEHKGKSIIGLYRLSDGYMAVDEIPANLSISEVNSILHRLLGIVNKQFDSIQIENGKMMAVVRIWITGLGYRWHSGPINGTFHETLRDVVQEEGNERLVVASFPVKLPVQQT